MPLAKVPRVVSDQVSDRLGTLVDVRDRVDGDWGQRTPAGAVDIGCLAPASRRVSLGHEAIDELLPKA
jgi:hypothetical protein